MLAEMPPYREFARLPTTTGNKTGNTHVRWVNRDIDLRRHEIKRQFSGRTAEHRTLICTSLSKEIQIKLEELEEPEHKYSDEGLWRRRQQLLAGGCVLNMNRSFIEQLEFAELEDHVWLLLWLVLGPQRLQHITKFSYQSVPEKEGMKLSWEQGGARLVWRALQLCCSAQGTKSPAAVPLPEEHACDLNCLRDHASRMLEVCAPTRELWRAFGWAGLTVDAVLQKVLKEDVLEHVALLPSVPPEVSAAFRRIENCRAAIQEARGASQRNQQLTQMDSETVETLGQDAGIIRRKRGRPAKLPPNTRREPGRLERVFLWRFLLELLDDPRLQGCLCWVHRDEGIFRILNTDMLARLWGRRHGNPRMTYEKMARAMRTYYRSRVLLPVPRARNLPRKLVYKFAPSVLERAASDSRCNVSTVVTRTVSPHSNLQSYL